ncbi:hypothetical protein AU152_gp41 [Mycobacterium phage Phlei]|uniref:Uncharacterized protein n=1 Tax=Mycobacterium phage Phlei TaxID=1690684 RepID=A0A0N9BDR3_9CAUD|nr:hypothetical protein AU152_gp41 [Mycobacterium phage Phlei]ALA48154.1 hypothetical protein [Mycobacterium phage Phlei]
MAKDHRIMITLNYEPNLKWYPGASTKAEALEIDVQAINDGGISIGELASYADDVTVSVVEVDVVD